MRLIVERPLHGIAGTDDDLELRSLAFRGDGRLVAGQRHASEWVRRLHASFKDGDDRAIGFDADQNSVPSTVALTKGVWMSSG